jgi:hypothetical protein
LLLLSPIGYKPKAPQEEISEEDLDKKFRILKTHPWWFIEMMRFSWVNQISPFSINRALG